MNRMDVKQAQREAFRNTAQNARDLAKALDGTDEPILGPSDTALCVAALRAFAAQVDAGFALVSPALPNEQNISKG